MKRKNGAPMKAVVSTPKVMIVTTNTAEDTGKLCNYTAQLPVDHNTGKGPIVLSIQKVCLNQQDMRPYLRQHQDVSCRAANLSLICIVVGWIPPPSLVRLRHEHSVMETDSSEAMMLYGRHETFCYGRNTETSV